MPITSKAALPNGKVGRAYATRLKFRGGTGAGSGSLVSGFPPQGLLLDRDGNISGTPAAGAGTNRPNAFMVRVTDANGSTYSKKFSILVKP